MYKVLLPWAERCYVSANIIVNVAITHSASDCFSKHCGRTGEEKLVFNHFCTLLSSGVSIDQDVEYNMHITEQIFKSA